MVRCKVVRTGTALYKNLPLLLVDTATVLFVPYRRGVCATRDAKL